MFHQLTEQMLVAYVLEHVVGLTIALAYFISVSLQRGKASCISRRCLEVFHDCSTFLTFSTQIAAIVVLVKVDFGLGTEDMGDATVRITQAVSALTLLPLAYAIVLLDHFAEIVERFPQFEQPERPGLGRKSEEASKRFGLCILCWILSLYPFYSKMNSVFGPSEIGAPSPGRPQPALSHEQFNIIEGICYQDVQVISGTEDQFMTAVAIIAFIPFSLLAFGRIVAMGVRKHYADSRSYLEMATIFQGNIARRSRQGMVLLLGIIPMLACGLLWTVIRVQSFQKQMASAIGNDYVDGKWAFGQVAAVTVFVPVLVEVWFFFSEQQTRERSAADM